MSPEVGDEVRSSGEDPQAVRGRSKGASLENVHASVAVPGSSAGFWRNWRAFVGPAILVSVGYMDPGNWATDLAAGAKYKYGLLWVVGLSSFMAMFLQIAAARLGIASGRDLAQACRDFYPKWTRWPNWLASEVAIAACDMAEVLGSAVAIHLLFPKISLFVAVLITACDVFLLLGLQAFGIRKVEAFILMLVLTIGGCYFCELFILPDPANRPDFGEMGRALLQPWLGETGMVALAIGIVGATVMPHNLYLHSALVQTRQYQKDDASIRTAIKFNTIDAVIALLAAFFVNAAILVMAAVTFHQYLVSGQGLPDGRGGLIAITDETDWIQVAFMTLSPLMGVGVASILFAVALLASGQSSTVTGTLAGQVIMEGFMHWRVRPWVRRLITRMVAILPAVIMIWWKGEESTNSLLVLSQVVLGMQLPLAMIPLMHLTSLRRVMGKYRNPVWLMVVGWTACILITSLDLYLLWGMMVG